MICSYITGLILHKRVQRHVTQFSCLNDVEKIFWEGQKCETEFTWSRDYTPNVDLYHHSFKKSFDTYPCDIIAIFKSITMWHTLSNDVTKSVPRPSHHRFQLFPDLFYWNFSFTMSDLDFMISYVRGCFVSSFDWSHDHSICCYWV